MKQQSTVLFWYSEINLIFWMTAVGFILFDDFQNPEVLRTLKIVAVGGCILAALLQHWAYHKIYKPIRKQKKQNKPSHHTV